MPSFFAFCLRRGVVPALALMACPAVAPVEAEEFKVTGPPAELRATPKAAYRGFPRPPLRSSPEQSIALVRTRLPRRELVKHALELDAFYEKFVSADGYPIIASRRVNDYALKEAAYLVKRLLAKRPDLRRAMIESGSRMVIMAHDEFTTDVPEYADFQPKEYWDARARGLGGSETDPLCSAAEENLLGLAGDPYATECILIHEFAHNIHLRGLVNIDSTFDKRLLQAYEAAMAGGLWKSKYASTNHHEYWAEGVQSWFDNNRPPDHDHNHVDTRAELIEYDPRLAKLCHEVFGDTKLAYTKPATRLVGHLAGYDPAKAPVFRWPVRLDGVRRNVRLEWFVASGAKVPASKADRPKTWVMFQNNMDRRVKLHWIDHRGELRPYGSLAPRATRWQSTFVASTWLITDEKGKPLGYFIAERVIARAVIPRRK